MANRRDLLPPLTPRNRRNHNCGGKSVPEFETHDWCSFELVYGFFYRAVLQRLDQSRSLPPFMMRAMQFVGKCSRPTRSNDPGDISGG